VAARATLTVIASWRALGFGRSTLYLDDPVVRLGGWFSGQVSAPPLIDGVEIRLRVECIYSDRTFDGSTDTVEWCGTAVLDGKRLTRKDGRVLIPFALRIFDTGRHTRPGKDSWVNWNFRVEARPPRASYAAEFPLQVLPADPSVPVAAVAPRAMPEIPSKQLAQRLTVETVGDTKIIHLPLRVLRTTLLILFLLATVAFAALGWWDAASVSFGLAVLVQLVLMLTTHRIEVRGESVRLMRGLFGKGFHATIPATDVVAVEEAYESNVKSGTWYGAALRRRDEKALPLVLCFRDPALAKALVHLLEQSLDPAHLSGDQRPAPRA
jgi:hypothetical protein